MKSTLQAIIALALFSFLFIAYGVWYSQVAKESATAAGLSQQIETKKQTAERASAIQSALEKLRSDENAVESYFISEGNVVTFLSELEAVGTDTHSQVKVVSIDLPSGLDGNTGEILGEEPSERGIECALFHGRHAPAPDDPAQ